MSKQEGKVEEERKAVLKWGELTKSSVSKVMTSTSAGYCMCMRVEKLYSGKELQGKDISACNI